MGYPKWTLHTLAWWSPKTYCVVGYCKWWVCHCFIEFSSISYLVIMLLLGAMIKKFWSGIYASNNASIRSLHTLVSSLVWNFMVAATLIFCCWKVVNFVLPIDGCLLSSSFDGTAKVNSTGWVFLLKIHFRVHSRCGLILLGSLLPHCLDTTKKSPAWICLQVILSWTETISYLLVWW